MGDPFDGSVSRHDRARRGLVIGAVPGQLRLELHRAGLGRDGGCDRAVALALERLAVLGGLRLRGVEAAVFVVRHDAAGNGVYANDQQRDDAGEAELPAEGQAAVSGPGGVERFSVHQ